MEVEMGEKWDVRETKVPKLLFKGFNEFRPDLVLFVVGFVVVSFLGACVAADGGDVDHAVPITVQNISRGYCSSFPPSNLPLSPLFQLASRGNVHLGIKHT